MLPSTISGRFWITLPRLRAGTRSNGWTYIQGTQLLPVLRFCASCLKLLGRTDPACCCACYGVGIKVDLDPL
jgi:hypothetical protein